jgi:hypothetical protein
VSWGKEWDDFNRAQSCLKPAGPRLKWNLPEPAAVQGFSAWNDGVAVLPLTTAPPLAC